MNQRYMALLGLSAAFGAVAIIYGPEVEAQPNMKSDFSTFRIHYKDEENAIKACASTVQETGQTLIFSKEAKSCMGAPGYQKSDLDSGIKNPVFAREVHVAFKVREAAENCFESPYDITMFNPETQTCSYRIEP